MILLSAHRDTVIPEYPLQRKNGLYVGLLDNMIGRLVLDLALFHPTVQAFEGIGLIQTYWNTYEEFGEFDEYLPKLTKKDILVAVDICSDKKYDGKDFAIENYNFKKAKQIVKDLRWEGYKVHDEKYDGKNEAAADEAWFNAKRGLPSLSFIIPINPVGPDKTAWHAVCSCPASRVAKASYGLIRLICFLAQFYTGENK